jgi:hypothetical protein
MWGQLVSIASRPAGGDDNHRNVEVPHGFDRSRTGAPLHPIGDSTKRTDGQFW